MSTHAAVAYVGKKQLKLIQNPTDAAAEGQIRIKVQYAVTSPFDLHQADAGFMVEYPAIGGCGYAGVVAEVGPSVTQFAVGDKVVGFFGPSRTTSGHQTFVTIPWYLAGKIPSNVSIQEAVTTAGSLVTVFRAMTHDFGLDLPWPVTADYVPKHANDTFLLWGGSGSVGLFAIPILRHWGYKRIFATASRRNHDMLRKLGATEVFDYNDPDVLDSIQKAAGPSGISFFLDCIGSLAGSIIPISKLAKSGSKVAILLPAIVREHSDTGEAEFSADVASVTKWADSVEPTGVRAFMYTDNPFLRDHAQPDIVPELLRSGIVKPLPYREVEGASMLERAENALELTRNKAVSAERLVWKVADE